MLLYWYPCISINTDCFGIYHISLKMVWWVLSNTSLIVWICLAIHEILANKTFTVANGLISQLFVVTFIHLTFGAFQYNLAYENQFTDGRDTSWIKFVTSWYDLQLQLVCCISTSYTGHIFQNETWRLRRWQDMLLLIPEE